MSVDLDEYGPRMSSAELADLMGEALEVRRTLMTSMATLDDGELQDRSDSYILGRLKLAEELAVRAANKLRREIDHLQDVDRQRMMVESIKHVLDELEPGQVAGWAAIQSYMDAHIRDWIQDEVATAESAAGWDARP